MTRVGWGWMVVAASFSAHFIADGCGFSFGILFTELLDVFNETTGRTAWIGSLFVSMPLICGPIASALTNKYGLDFSLFYIMSIGFILRPVV